MQDSWIQSRFSERIGGNRFGKDTTIYKFEKIKRAKRAAIAENPNIEIIDMGVGEPDDMAFPEVVIALGREAGVWENRTYADNGIIEFKQAVANYMKDLYGVTLDPDTEILHAMGSKSSLSLMPSCFINPGDITVMTVPGYPIMGTWTMYLGGEVINLPLKSENGYLPDLESIPEEKRGRIKLIYLNYPNNPTGASATVEFFKKAIAFAKKYNALIISDAAYAPLNFTGKPLSILSVEGGREQALELHSMSKGFNMTGWRLGWICGYSPAVKAFATVKDNADSGQFIAIQKAAIEALKRQDTITPKICEKYERRLAFLAETLSKLGFNAKKPEGSFYLYTRAPKGVKNGPSFESGEAFSQWMIKEKLISTVPWDDVEPCVRFSATFVARGGAKEEQRVLEEFARRLSDCEFIF